MKKTSETILLDLYHILFCQIYIFMQRFSLNLVKKVMFDPSHYRKNNIFIYIMYESMPHYQWFEFIEVTFIYN